VRQTIIKKGCRFFRAPTRSLRDVPAIAEDPKAVGPKGGRASRLLLLYRRGIQRIPVTVAWALSVSYTTAERASSILIAVRSESVPGQNRK